MYHLHREGCWVAEGDGRIEIISIRSGRQELHAGDVEGPVAIHKFCFGVRFTGYDQTSIYTTYR
jgi:hypothetical protein